MKIFEVWLYAHGKKKTGIKTNKTKQNKIKIQKMENYKSGTSDINYLSKNYVNSMSNMGSVNTSAENAYNNLIKYLPKGNHIGNYGPSK
ncbi:MAG: hypothetical protein AABY32_07370 [Nanoarchaeota archaeon]